MSISTRKKALWKVFSAYIKARDKYVCQTCGKKVEGYNCQGGHYIAKAACNPEYYFHEGGNVMCQCGACNCFLEGNRPAFRQKIIDRFGKEALDDIERNYNKSIIWSEDTYRQKEKYYKEKLKTVENLRGLFGFQSII